MTAAVVALHYQNEVLHPDGRIRVGLATGDARRAAVIDRAGRLMSGARALRVPVVSVRVAFRPDYADVVQNAPIFRAVVAQGAMAEGSWGAGFLDGLGPEPGEFVVTHNRIGAFHGSALGDVLRAIGADHLVIAGVATTSVVLTTVGQAADLGFRVTVAADACAAARADLHDAALQIMALVAEVAPVEAVLAGLAAGQAG